MIDAISDQAGQMSRLQHLVRTASVPHALLFTGVDGIGKTSAAMAFAMYMNCRDTENPAKDILSQQDCTCRSCHKIRSDMHPDILSVKPSGNVIKIAQIRDLCLKLLVKPCEAKTRIVLIHDADAMNPEAGNALLKSLEEPPDHTMFILISNQASDILPTLLSRCQHIGFKPLSVYRITEILVQKLGISQNDAHLFAAMSGGSPGRAIELASTSGAQVSMTTFRRFLFDELSGIKRKTTSEIFLFAEKLSSKKEKAVEALDILMTYVRDLMIFPFSPDKVANRDMIQKLAELSGRISLTSLTGMSEHIMTAQKAIQSNVSLRLALEVMAINMKRV